MLVQIVRATPLWVWALLVALIVLGAAQLRTREVGLRRLTIVPIAMTVLSASGLLSAFGASLPAVGAWLGGLAAALTLGARWVAARGIVPSARPGVLKVSGSVVPLLLILALFAIKYFVGVQLAMHPERGAEPAFAMTFSAAYGFFAGLFLARGASLRRAAGRGTGELQVA